MKTRKVILAILAGMGIIVSYTFYKPVPDGFPEPWRYRLHATGMQVFGAIIHIKMCVRDRRCPNILERLVEGFDVIDPLIPTPPEEVPGSNIRSQVTSFDGIRVRVYEPIERDGKGDLPAFLYFHGGGLAVGNIDMYDDAVRLIAESLNIVGIAVSYRTAPEHIFPAAFDDVFAATKWFLSHAAAFGVDPQRVALMGDSAGGLLTAVVAGAISEEPSLPDIKLQVLLYPWLQSFDHNTPSMQKAQCPGETFGEALPLYKAMPHFLSAYVLGITDEDLSHRIAANEHTSAEFKRSPFSKKHLNHDLIPADMKLTCYVPPTSDDVGDDDLWESMKDALTSTKFSPLYREDFSKLPRAFVATCGYDCLRDDGIFYTRRLEGAGVPVKWVNYKDGYHGVTWFGNNTFEIGRQMANDFIEYTKEHL